jgi:hypothetical protein
LDLQPRDGGDGWTLDPIDTGATLYLRKNGAFGMVVIFQLPAGLGGDCPALLAAASPRWATAERTTTKLGEAILTRMVDRVPACTAGQPPQTIGPSKTFWSVAIGSRGRCVSLTVAYDERHDATMREVAGQLLDSVASDS